ncbi:MAG: S-layer family protein, partial [Proteobacteria bacterium]|nr:S-layer family protein [Pseudomonadota bacterium]
YLYNTASGSSLEVDSGITLQGYGVIAELYSNSALTNNGSIIANTTGQIFTVGNTLISNTFTNNGTLSATAGTLNVGDTTFTNNATINLASEGTFARSAGFTNSANGVIKGNGTINLSSGTLTNEGSINPGGLGIGQLNIKGNLVNSTAGAINIDIGGLVPSTQHDKLMVSGTATLGGNLNISNIGTYLPGPADSFNVLGAGTISGTFASVNTPVGSAYLPQYNSKLAWLSLSSTALPSTINAWLIDGDGYWYVASNWTNQLVPTSVDSVVIDRPGGVYTVTNNTSGSLAGSLLSNENLLLSGGTLTVTGMITTAANTTVTNPLSLGANILWNNSGTLDVSGTGSLNLTSGSQLNNLAAGVVNLSGTYSSPVSGIGIFNNVGTLNKTSTASQTIPTVFNNTGTVNVDAGTLVINNTFAQSGTINVASGATINRAAGFTNTGTLSGTGTIAVGTGTSKLINQGNINPGGTGKAGTLTISGDLLLDTGSNLNIELGGTGTGQSDNLAVTGAITSSGTLNASLLGGYAPTNADAIPFMTAKGSASGTFTTTNLPAGFSAGYNLASGEAARLIYAGSTGPGGTAIFTNAGGGLDWATPGNWSNSILPGALDSVLISSGLAVTHATGSDSIAALSINSGNSLNVSGGSLAVSGITTLSGDLAVSGTGSAALNGTLNGGTSGQVIVSGGALALNGASTVKNATLSGGVLGGSGLFTVTNSYADSGGTVDRTGGISINQAAGNLTFTAANVGAVALATAAGDIQLGSVNADGIVTAAAVGALNSAAAISATSLTASATTGISLTGSNSVPTVTLVNSTSGNVDYWGSNITLINGQNAGGGSFSVNSDSNIGLGSISNPAGIVSISSKNGSITNTLGTNNITASAAVLSAYSGIGTTGNPIKTELSDLSATSSTTGGVYISNTGPLSVTDMWASGDVWLANSGSLSINNIRSNSGNATVTAMGTTSDISVNEMGYATGSNVTLNAGRDVLVTGGSVFSTDSAGLTAVTAGRDVEIVGGTESGGEIRAVNDVKITATTGKLYLTSNGTYAKVEAQVPYTIYLDFPGQASGGYVIDGVEGGATVSGINSNTGFFIANSPAVDGINVHITNAAPPAPPSPPEPTVDQCIANPALSGCSAVLPSLATCTVTPTAPGCSVILPTIATCISSPATAGCSAVLPTVATCTATPSAAGCSVVLPAITSCATDPTAPGCSVVLPQQEQEALTGGGSAAISAIDSAIITPVAPAGLQLVGLVPPADFQERPADGSQGGSTGGGNNSEDKDKDIKKDVQEQQPADGDKKDAKPNKNYCN